MPWRWLLSTRNIGSTATHRRVRQDRVGWAHLFLISTLICLNSSILSLSSNVIGQYRVRSNHASDRDPRTCGNWQGPYEHLDRAIKEGTVYPRYTVMAYSSMGLSDAQSCMITAFMYSVLTKRAFVLQNLDDSFKLQDGYDRPNIDWTFQVDETGRSVHRVSDLGTGGEEPKSSALPIFRKGNLHDIGKDADVVMFEHCNFGTVIQLTHNPYHKSEIFHMGLRPETIFGCVFDFLFEPTSAAKALFRKELDKMQQKNTLKIAIQIRTSDTAMAQNGLVLDEQNSKKDALLNPYENYFACAKELQEDNQQEGQDVIWLLVSDREDIRKAAAQRYPTLILTNTKKGLVQHTSIPAGQGPLSGGRQALLAAVGEKLLISLADYFVISNSGFGRLPAVQGRRWNSIYTINPNQPRDCHLEGDSYEDLSRRLPGVRHFL